MRRTLRHRKILLLMITSQLLLTIFVLQWLRSQYREERTRLADDLTSLYLETQDEMVDTLLFKSYVSPILNGDSLTQEKERLTGIVRWEGEKGRVAISVNHGPDTAGLPDTIRLRRTKNDLLLRSVRMIISHSEDTLRADRPLVRNFGITPDTSAFKLHFSERLEDAGLNFNLVWIQDSAGNGKIRKALFLAPLNPFSLPAVTVKKYDRYLAGKILPQILFGLLLICLTALAFMLSYRSLREHSVLNDLRNEFISNMTHELKTPVSSISIALESLSKYNLMKDPQLMDEYMKLALSETERLEHLINRVLDHSVIEQNFQSLNLTETDLNDLIADVTSSMKTRIQEKGTISFTPSGNKLMVKCDQLLLKGVIMNLLDNSIKYSGSSPEIRITAESEGRSAVISVTDNGPGIPKEYHDKIFEKFFRIPSGNVHNVKGYGLGLSFASLVMKQHNGSIGVNNAERGCTFTLKIPLYHE